MWKVLILCLSLLVLVFGTAAAAAWRYEEARRDRLADGIVIAGVDVGGMRVSEARGALEARLADPLKKPVAVLYRHGQFVFSPSQAGVETNLDQQLDDALAASRRGNFLSRAVRDATGGRLGERLSVDVTYSDEAVQQFVTSVSKAVDRKPRAAKSSASFAGVRISQSRNGVEVMEATLAARISAVLVDPDAPRSLDLPVRVLPPKTTTKALRKRFHTFLAVSRSKKQLRLFVDLKLAKTYRVAIGAIGYETPAGLYEIVNKAVNPAWYVPKEAWAGDLAGKIIPPGDPENPLKARWMGFYAGAGIHGTADASSIGSAASHGCIRMRVPDVIQLYQRVPLHTPLSIS